VTFADRHPAYLLAFGVCLALALVVGAQALAQVSAPPVHQISQAKLIGQTGFAYLGGLRVMAAGLLWGTLDAQFHQYMSDSDIKDRLDLLPAIRAVQLLNPQLEQPYYFTSYVLAKRNRMNDALELAREGIKNNPRSGLLRANYIQLLLMQGKKSSLPLMLEQARIGLGPNIEFVSADDAYESFSIFSVPFKLTGDMAAVKAIDATKEELRQQGAAPTGQRGGLEGLISAWTNSATTEEEHGSQSTTSGAK
jgi:hypothetical protein